MTGRLTGRMGSRPILPIRRPITIGTIVKLDGDGDGMCKQALTLTGGIFDCDGQKGLRTDFARQRYSDGSGVAGCGWTFMVCSHWLEPRPGQGPGTNGLYETVWKLSHYTWTRTGLSPIVPHCSGPGPCTCLGPGSAQCEYTINCFVAYSRSLFRFSC